MVTEESDRRTRVLLVEDDVSLATLVRDYLMRHEFDVDVVHRGDEAASRLESSAPDILLLDLNLPGTDGLDVCRAIRSTYVGSIVMFTARDEDFDEVVGLELGADDYLTKPIAPRLLLARLRALIRRHGRLPAVEAGGAERLRYGELQIDGTRRSVHLGSREVVLTTMEFDLLWLLASRAGDVIDRDYILRQLRGIDYDGLDRSVDIGISRLRRKLEDDSARPFRIKTVRARGYLFVRDAWG